MKGLFPKLWVRLKGLLQTSAGNVIVPTMIGAANTAVFQESVVKRRTTMGTVFTNKTVATFLVAKKDKLFAQDLDSLLGLRLRQLPNCSNGLPVTTQELTAGSPSANLG